MLLSPGVLPCGDAAVWTAQPACPCCQSADGDEAERHHPKRHHLRSLQQGKLVLGKKVLLAMKLLFNGSDGILSHFPAVWFGIS